MNLIDRVVGAVRGLSLIDHKIEQLERSVENMTAKIDSHDRRLVRIETIIEFSRPSYDGQPRLPR